jgi:hypothetical protein
MLANAGYEVETLDLLQRQFTSPAVRHIAADITALAAHDIAGYDAILCCETLEHIDWQAVPAVLTAFHDSGAKHLVVSVPYMAFQITFDFYLNAQALRHYFSMKKLLSRREFAREPPGGHQWEIGYKGYPLKRWENRLADCGWRIVRREFTAHTARSSICWNALDRCLLSPCRAGITRRSIGSGPRCKAPIGHA